jgi:hypothetical protein
MKFACPHVLLKYIRGLVDDLRLRLVPLIVVVVFEVVKFLSLVHDVVDIIVFMISTCIAAMLRVRENTA